MGLQRVGHNWVTELNWTELMIPSDFSLLFGFATKFDVVATFYCTWILEGLQWVKSQSTLNVMCSCCFSATQPCPILCDSVDCSTPGFPVHYQLLEFASEKAMAPHSSTFAWWIPWTEEPGGLPSMGSHRVGHDQSDLAAAELAQTHVHGVVMPSNHLILCRPLFLPSVFPSIRVFSNESVLLIRWPKYWSFSLSISYPNEYSGLISFSTDWFDLLASYKKFKKSLMFIMK